MLRVISLEAYEGVENTNELVGSIGCNSFSFRSSCSGITFRTLSVKAGPTSKTLPTQWSRRAHLQVGQILKCRRVWYLAQQVIHDCFTTLAFQMGVEDLSDNLELLFEVGNLCLKLLCLLFLIRSGSLRRDLIAKLLLFITWQFLVILELVLQLENFLLTLKEVCGGISELTATLLPSFWRNLRLFSHVIWIQIDDGNFVSQFLRWCDGLLGGRVSLFFNRFFHCFLSFTLNFRPAPRMLISISNILFLQKVFWRYIAWRGRYWPETILMPVLWGGKRLHYLSWGDRAQTRRLNIDFDISFWKDTRRVAWEKRSFLVQMDWLQLIWECLIDWRVIIDTLLLLWTSLLCNGVPPWCRSSGLLMYRKFLVADHLRAALPCNSHIFRWQLSAILEL